MSRDTVTCYDLCPNSSESGSHLAVAQLGPVSARDVAAPQLLYEDDQLLHALPPPLLQLVQAGEAADEDLGAAEGVLVGTNRQLAQEVGHTLYREE